MSPFPAPEIDASERSRLRWVIAAVLLAITLPYLWVACITPPGYVFRGLLFSPDDQDVHLAWAQQAAAGHFFFRDLFTTENFASDEHPLFNNLFCFAMGAISGLSRIPLLYVYHGLRLLFSALALLLFYGLCARVTPDKQIRFVALLLAAFSLGCGWLMDFGGIFKLLHFVDRPDGSYPMMPEAFTFSSALVFPLFIASMALLLATYNGVLDLWNTGSKKALASACIAALLLANIHTYDALPLVVVLLLWLAAESVAPPPEPDTGANAAKIKRLALFVPIIAAALLPVFLQWLVFHNSQEFQIKALTPTPAESIPSMLFSYGLLVPLAIAGAIALRRTAPGRLLALWAFVTFAMTYAPVSFARKMIEGLDLPICLLAAVGLIYLLANATPSPRKIIALAAVALMCVSSVRFVLWCTIDNPRDNNASRGLFMPPLYLSEGDWDAEQYLKALPEQTKLSRAVLCLPKLGNCIPADAGMYVYVGHWAETLYPGDKLKAACAILTGQVNGNAARQWLQQNHIGYIVIGPYEQELTKETGSLGIDAQALHLKLVMTSHDTSVYQVPDAPHQRNG